MPKNTCVSKVTSVRKMLLPAPPPFVQWLERVLTLLPNQFQPVTLRLVSDVKALNADNGDYYATGDLPCFELKAELAAQSAGWFYLEAAVVRHGGNRIAKLYVDRGNGYCEDDSIFIQRWFRKLRQALKWKFCSNDDAHYAQREQRNETHQKESHGSIQSEGRVGGDQG